MPVSELTERVTRAIEASNVSSAPLVVETTNRVTYETTPTPWPHPALGSMLRHARPLATPDVWVSARCLGHSGDRPRWPTVLHSMEILWAWLEVRIEREG